MNKIQQGQAIDKLNTISLEETQYINNWNQSLMKSVKRRRKISELPPTKIAERYQDQPKTQSTSTKKRISLPRIDRGSSSCQRMSYISIGANPQDQQPSIEYDEAENNQKNNQKNVSSTYTLQPNRLQCFFPRRFKNKIVKQQLTPTNNHPSAQQLKVKHKKSSPKKWSPKLTIAQQQVLTLNITNQQINNRHIKVLQQWVEGKKSGRKSLNALLHQQFELKVKLKRKILKIKKK